MLPRLLIIESDEGKAFLRCRDCDWESPYYHEGGYREVELEREAVAHGVEVHGADDVKLDWS